MRNVLTVAALVVFVVSAGLLEMLRRDHRAIADLPPAMGTFDAPEAGVDRTAVTSSTQR